MLHLKFLRRYFPLCAVIMMLLIFVIIQVSLYKNKSCYTKVLSAHEKQSGWMGGIFAKQITLRPKTKYIKMPRVLQLPCWNDPCPDSKKTVNWTMVMFVKSAANHSFHRELLRQTWGSYSYIDGFKLSTIFVTGKAEGNYQSLIDEEHERYGDILQLNISDAYLNIAQKTLGGMQWASEHLSDDYFYSSCDDDFMVDISGLVTLLKKNVYLYEKERPPEFPIICTYKSKVDDFPERKNSSKWFVPEHEYKWSYWPDYCLGGAYSMSVRVMRQLWEVSRKENLIRMDDVYITGVLREKIGFPRQFVKTLNNSLAGHYVGFKEILSNPQLNFMKKWNDIKPKSRQKSLCVC